ncbi:MAG: sporulation transcriptional regulator SpoIIID [Clostridia bacterium]|nr:sporulation transcriptional regulator SpoIIID [Clostridia bacterium]
MKVRFMSVDRLTVRCIKIGEFIKNSSATVRETANRFGLSKSTVHKDATERLKKIDQDMYCSVRAILEKNKSERHIRGGEATRIKYLKKIDNIHKIQK